MNTKRLILPVLTSILVATMCNVAPANAIRTSGSPTTVGSQQVSLDVLQDCHISSAPGKLDFGNVDNVAKPPKKKITNSAPVSSFTMNCNTGTQWAVDLETDPAATASYSTANTQATGAMTGASTGHSYPFTAQVVSNATGTSSADSTPYTVLVTAGLFPTDDAPVDSYLGHVYITLYFS